MTTVTAGVTKRLLCASDIQGPYSFSSFYPHTWQRREGLSFLFTDEC